MVRMNRVYQDAALRLLWVGCIVAAVVGFIFLMVFWNPTFFSRQSAGEPAASVAPTATASPASASQPSPSVAKPVLPEAAKDFSEAGGLAFFGYFKEVVDYALATDDTQLLEDISLPGNVFTKNIVVMIKDSTSLSDERTNFKILNVYFDKEESLVEIDVESASRYVGKKTVDAPTYHRFIGKWQGNRWQMKNLVNAKKN